MWFLKNIVWLVIMILVVGFAILNVNETITAIVLPGRVYRQLPSNVVLFVAYVVGMITAFVLMLVHHLKIQSAIRRVNRENQNLKQELSQLRNLPLEDLRSGERGEAHRG